MIEILKYYKILKVSGIDAANFLQQLFTGDVVNNIYSYNFLLNSQGRFVADFFVFQKTDNEYFIEIHESLIENFKTMLQLYKMRKNVQIEDISQTYVLLYFASIDRNLLSNMQYIFSFQDPRSDILGYRTMIDASDLATINQYITKDNLYLEDKYQNAIPDGFADMVQNKSMPIQYGIDTLNAIDYTKGCYIGQEIISRAKYQGNIRKKIFKGKINCDSNAIFCDVTRNYPYLSISDLNEIDVMNPINNEKVGKVCSVYKNHALLLLSTEKINDVQDNTVSVLNNANTIYFTILS